MPFDSEKRYQEFLYLRSEGKTVSEIGKIFGITHQAVSERLRKGPPKRQFLGSVPGGIGILADSGFQKLTGKDRARMMVRIRDKFTCLDCGRSMTPEEKKLTRKMFFDVHHLDWIPGVESNGYDKTTDLTRLVTLCHSCHGKRHKEHLEQINKNTY